MEKVAVTGQPYQRLTNRQALLVELLAALGGGIGNLDFQKKLFLYCQEQGDVAPFEFVPYRFGAFSFTCYAERRKLVEAGILIDDERHWVLSTKGEKAAALLRSHSKAVTEFASRYAKMTGDELVAHTYKKFPYYAVRSELAPRLLRNEAEALQKIKASLPTTHGPKILTIGYEGKTLEGYLNALIRSGATLLCDVRRNPLSRKYGFSKKTLSNACIGVGIHYEHLPELGIESERRQYLESEAQYRQLFIEYTDVDLRQNMPALRKIRDWCSEGQRVALTCFEKDPQQCHRHCVAVELQTAFGHDFVAHHL